jgi:protein gp37
MAHPFGGGRYWWDLTWNTVFGCKPPSPGCLNCYAARAAGTLQTDTEIERYLGTTDLKQGRYVFNGHLKYLPRWHEKWNYPLRVKALAEPVMGPGMPTLLWAGDMSDLFLPGHPGWVIDRTIARLAYPEHIIGLILTKHPERMAAYFNALPATIQQHYREKLWLGFSAERQREFDERWPAMRELARQGWTVFVSIAPMIGPVTLPDDFLALGKWVICSGEQGKRKDVRYMSPNWARAVRDQCVAAGVPFFMKQMSGKRPIPFDLSKFQQFPRPWIN